MININQNMMSESWSRMSFEMQKNVLMNSQYINQHNQSTVETITAISNMFFKQKSEIKHMHTMGVVVVKGLLFYLFIFFFDELCPRRHNKGHISPVSESIRTDLGQAKTS